MIINTGSRTDIPAYYSDWFYNRIKEGYVCTRNPYYPEQVLRYRLHPDVVDCLVFCTKNPEPMLARVSEIKAYHQFWGVTITPYGKDIEPYVPDKETVMDTFCKLSGLLGVHAVSWRYDPIFITEKYSSEFHIKTFTEMAMKLEGYTDHCVISFIDLYQKTKRNFPGVREVSKEEQIKLVQAFVRIGKEHGIRIKTCLESAELEQYGVDISGCMTKSVLEKAIGCSLQVPKKKAPREGCECLLGNDIGMYNTCGHGCMYCYANYDRETVIRNMKLHEKDSPFLIGGYREGDLIKDVKQESYCDGQICMQLE